jgi:hypothetical protein
LKTLQDEVWWKVKISLHKWTRLEISDLETAKDERVLFFRGNEVLVQWFLLVLVIDQVLVWVQRTVLRLKQLLASYDFHWSGKIELDCWMKSQSKSSQASDLSVTNDVRECWELHLLKIFQRVSFPAHSHSESPSTPKTKINESNSHSSVSRRVFARNMQNHSHL